MWLYVKSANNYSVIRNVTILPNPADSNTSINCSANVTDNEQSNINISFTWFLNNTPTTKWNTTVYCLNSSWCYTNLSLTGILKHTNITCSVRAFDGELYTNWSNSSWLEVQNTIPWNITLLTPSHNNNSVYDRTPFFNWTNATDVDNDSLIYEIWIRREQCNAPPFTCLVPEIRINVTESNYTPGIDLDVESVYNWTVRAWDSNSTVSLWSNTSNFTVASLNMITVNQTPNFTQVYLEQEFNTTNGTYRPFIIQNLGNIRMNVSIYANQSLWINQPLNTTFFQFKVDNIPGFNSFSNASTMMAWANITGTTYGTRTHAIGYFNFTDHNIAEIDIRLFVPEAEPPGNRTSTLFFEAEYSG